GVCPRLGTAHQCSHHSWPPRHRGAQSGFTRDATRERKDICSSNMPHTSLSRDFYLAAVALSGQISCVHHCDRVVCQSSSALGFTTVIHALHEVLKFLRIPVHPVFVGCRVTPALLGPDFFDDVDISELLLLRVVGGDGINRIDIAASTMIIGHHFHPVVDT